MTAEKLEGLAGMVGEADALGGPTPEEAQAQEQAAAASEAAKEWGAIAYGVGGFLSMMAPELKAVYTEARCLAWGAAVVPVAEKYGWSSTKRFPELALAMATLGLAVPTFFVLKRRLAEDGEAGKPAEGVGGTMRQWFRNWRAKRAAKVVGEAVEVPSNGGAP